MTAQTAQEECLHLLDPRTCSVCRKAAGYRPGTDRQENDCTIRTVMHLTGGTYAEAEDALRTAGRRNGAGAPHTVTRAALQSLGFTCRPYCGTPDDALRASAAGRTFFVSARKGGRTGHAWAIVYGTAHDPYLPPFRYNIWEVS
jgi:hypothetical protein